jgi:hypothetical protein
MLGVMTHLPTNVVDLARFRAERDQARLPLFDGVVPVESPLQAAVEPAPAGPALSDRQVRHRARMLRYLTATRAGSNRNQTGVRPQV